jgi:hypothetical protein
MTATEKLRLNYGRFAADVLPEVITRFKLSAPYSNDEDPTLERTAMSLEDDVSLRVRVLIPETTMRRIMSPADRRRWARGARPYVWWYPETTGMESPEAWA